MNIYQIASDYEKILQDLYDDEGNVNQTALVALEKNEQDMETKMIAISSFVKNIEAQKNAIADAKKDILEREKKLNKKIDELKGYLLTNMERRGIKEINTPYFDIKLKKNPASVDIIDENSIPDEYRRIKTEVVLDKVKMKDEMLLGVIIPGASLKQGLRVEIR